MTRTRQKTKSLRRGYLLIFFALLLAVLLGLVGLVIDSGLMMGGQRHAQNAADSGARAGALHLRADGTASELRQVVETFVYSRNGVPVSTELDPAEQLIVNHPPVAGAYAGRQDYVEVIVSYPVPSTFIRILGASAIQHVRARAVAGFQQHELDAGVVVLDPEGNPGLSVSGTNAALNVDASILVFTRREGENEYGWTVGEIAAGHPSVEVNGAGATMIAEHLFVSGGVDDVNNYLAPNIGELHAGTLDPVWDPFHIEGNLLRTPTTSRGVVDEVRGDVTVTNNSQTGLELPNSHDPATGETTLHPGIYEGIKINGGIVRFEPGIYVLRPRQNFGGGDMFAITGGEVTGQGVMFYNTGNDYVASTGAPDVGDESLPTDQPPARGGGTKYGRISIHGENVTLTGIQEGHVYPNEEIHHYNDILFFQRRSNEHTISVSDGMAPPGGLQGIVYAKWGELKIAGSGTYNFGTVLGRLTVNGNAIITVANRIPLDPLIEPVRLVE